MTVFGPEYANAYDALYQEKDYAAECDLLERLFAAYGSNVKRVLDLGCGTGAHSALLAQRGYDVVGVDRSEDMLRQARLRTASARFEQADITHADLGQTFDAVVIMFAVLGYLISNTDVRSALAAARRHLRPGGLLFADVWYGPAVLAQRPSERVKVIPTPTGKVIRAATGELDTRRDVCTVQYQVWRLEHETVVSETRERHEMRYFFEPELDMFLSSAGFGLARVGSFPDFELDPSDQAWNVAFVARAL